MIDTLVEKPITFSQAAAELPRRRAGRKTAVSTLFRWTSEGCRGVILESIQVGGTRCTSREALQRFFERLSQSSQAGTVGKTQPEPPIRPHVLDRRQRLSASARKTLVETGV
jgi:Protein of unknown function (DUF1580)